MSDEELPKIELDVDKFIKTNKEFLLQGLLDGKSLSSERVEEFTLMPEYIKLSSSNPPLLKEINNLLTAIPAIQSMEKAQIEEEDLERGIQAASDVFENFDPKTKIAVLGVLQSGREIKDAEHRAIKEITAPFQDKDYRQPLPYGFDSRVTNLKKLEDLILFLEKTTKSSTPKTDYQPTPFAGESPDKTSRIREMPPFGDVAWLRSDYRRIRYYRPDPMSPQDLASTDTNPAVRIIKRLPVIGPLITLATGGFDKSQEERSTPYVRVDQRNDPTRSSAEERPGPPPEVDIDAFRAALEEDRQSQGPINSSLPTNGTLFERTEQINPISQWGQNALKTLRNFLPGFMNGPDR
jgi:hypothetical protein